MEDQVCPECGSEDLKYSEEGLVCQECGLVVESSQMFYEENI